MPSTESAPNWGCYVHVPFCATRCGYCDFNTYTANELGPGASRATYADTVIEELRLARLSLPNAPALETVFFGGGTPTLLGADDLVRILQALRDEFEITPTAEVTTEANPDSIDTAGLARLREGGFTRVSFGVQSLAPHVLATLERTHSPGRSLQVLAEARAVGFDHVSADLIYATPGETDDDLRRSLDAVLASDVDHLSAYSLIVEGGTRLAARVRRGEIAEPDDDTAASRYLIVDEAARQAGMTWYEVSNWARPGGECRHNLGYWRGGDWWGAGPGAHGHLRGRRWWNLKHPATYAAQVAQGVLPIEGDETVSADDQRVEDTMLRMRLREGMLATRFDQRLVDELVGDGLIVRRADRIALTDSARLLADGVVRRLVS